MCHHSARSSGRWGRSAYSSRPNTQKKQLHSASVKKGSSKNSCLVRKTQIVSVRPPISSVNKSYNNHSFCLNLQIRWSLSLIPSWMLVEELN